MLSPAHAPRPLFHNILLFAAMFAWVSCRQAEGPQVAYEHTKTMLVHGDLAACQSEAEKGYQRFRRSNPEWAWKFKLLEAEALLWSGKYPQALALLNSEATRPNERDSLLRFLALQSAANARMQEYTKATEELEEADQLCRESADKVCGDVIRTHGVLAVQKGDTTAASNFFQQSLSFARNNNDRMLEATALLNLGLVYFRDGRFDEAIDWSEAAYKAAAALDASLVMRTAIGNLGWDYYKLGDFERALQAFSEAENRSAQMGNVIGELISARGAGRVYADLHQNRDAARSYQKALDLAEESHARDEIYTTLREMAFLALQSSNIDDAARYADRSLQFAKVSGDRADQLYPLLVQGQVAARHGDSTGAQKLFQQVDMDRDSNGFLKWEAQHLLARLYESEKKTDAADGEYRAALTTFEGARSSVRREDFQLSFLTNAAHIYDDYVHFLIAQGKTDEALRWADYSRARTLSEGLGLLTDDQRNGPQSSAGKNDIEKPGAVQKIEEKKSRPLQPPVFDARATARRAKGSILYYWLGENQSYLWAITPHEIKLFPLPAATEIETRAERYRGALTGPADVLQSSNEDGQWLYRTLIAPAQPLLPKDSKVFIIPDGKLNNLNFETLIVRDPSPHFWIDDAVITDSSSLLLLSASFRGERKHNLRRLLLIGNSIAPNDQYPALPNAAIQMESVNRHFTATQRQVFSGVDATPTAYLATHPEQFSHIHFVAHGTASRLSPLDSAIVLSKSPAEPDSFKLYARDIIRHPLRTDMVTISACYGAGERAYSGEGLVGLAWAFLRAGAHNVIAGLWEVTDASTAQLMDRFYDELDKGAGPDAALRAAKLSLLHGSAFRNPFYWAPFQLYAGS
jgi:CHAT domain-containing protein